MVIGALGLLMPACSLDRYPTTQILLEDAFQTFEDAERHRNGLYNELRRVRHGVFTTTTELMSDLFNASVGFGNRGGQPHRLAEGFRESTEVRDIWVNLFGAIAQVNFFLDNIENIEPANAEETARIILFTLEAHYARAFLYTVLAQHFMYPINPNNPTMTHVVGGQAHSIDAPQLGLPLLSRFDFHYRPTRATIRETFDFILADIAATRRSDTIAHGIFPGDAPVVARLPQSRHNLDPEMGATTPGQITMQQAGRITSDAVDALEARVRFMMRDEEAVAIAERLISSNRYPLIAAGEGTLRAMWRDDNSPEDIFILHATRTSFGTASTGAGGGFSEMNMAIFSTRNTSTGGWNPDFLPTQSVLDLYEGDDNRLLVFFSAPGNVVEYTFRHHGVRFFHKFPGNGVITTGQNRRHRPRMHSIAEMYLIVAEVTQAPQRLNQLRAARGAAPINYTGEALLNAIRDEWAREKIGEGFRIESLRRWGPDALERNWGFGTGRRVPQDPTSVHNYGHALFTERQITAEEFYLFTLPIPPQDMRANPNMRQTPSWTF